MSSGFTHTTRPHADASVGPRPGVQIIEQALERADDVAAERETARRRVAQMALAAAAASLAPMSVLALLVRHDGLDIVLSCDDATTWRAHHEPVDGDGFPLDPDERVVEGEGATPVAALNACLRRARELEAPCG